MAIIDYERILNDFRDEVKDKIITNIVDIDSAKKFISYNIKAIKRRVSSEDVECFERYLAYKPDYIELDGYNNDILQRKSYFLKAKDGSYSNLALYFKVFIILKLAEKFSLLNNSQEVIKEIDSLWNTALKEYASKNNLIETKAHKFVEEHKGMNISIKILAYLKGCHTIGVETIKIIRELEKVPAYKDINTDVANFDYLKLSCLDNYKIPQYLLPYYIVYVAMEILPDTKNDGFYELKTRIASILE
ncbi:hypothetical protein [uncultured Campylobacter sp.]|uniref:hypothetical protein n=1 Tax=uncultured Campylobacter sp. TaxID=218934 RepID=UPI00260DE97F|nr:hypothetical protein [uncultured Campylobacter sp.]